MRKTTAWLLLMTMLLLPMQAGARGLLTGSVQPADADTASRRMTTAEISTRDAERERHRWYITQGEGGCFRPRNTPLADTFPGMRMMDSITPARMLAELKRQGHAQEDDGALGLIFYTGTLARKLPTEEKVSYVFAILREDWCAKNNFSIK